MKTSFLCSHLAAGLSLLAIAAPLPAQTSAGTRAPAPANQPQDVQVRDKEKAEDAALLQQLDAEEPPVRELKRSGARGMGGGNRRVGTTMNVAPAGLPGRNQLFLTRGATTPKALLVRTSSPDAKSQAALEEDLAVMAHLLMKAIEELPGGQTRAVNALGIEVTEWSRPGPLRSLYLDNYGALFFLNVGFPLVAPEEKQPEEKPGADSAWEDARQELYGLRPQAIAGEPAQDYSPEKVEKLKQTLLESLKNATNIRDLKPDEFVTLCVSGGVTGSPTRRVFKNNPPGTLGGNLEVLEQPAQVSRRTVLTIRASKGDIDAYAKGGLSAEEFHKHARVTAYTDDARGSGFEGLIGAGGGGGAYGGRARF